MKNSLKCSFLANQLIVFICLLAIAGCKDSELPVVETANITDITSVSARSGGIISSDGGGTITEKGVCWSITSNPTLEDAHTSDGTGNGDYESVLLGLLADTDYFVRAYATNDAGTSYGDEKSFKTEKQSTLGQIIADHTIVARFDDIPQEYIDKVKKMWLVYAGESHSEAIRTGLTQLESIDNKYQVNVKSSGTPDPYTDQHLRASGATWGDISSSTGWIYSYGEEDWFTTALAITRTKAGITYCNSNNLTISAMGFGWCWDNSITAGEDISAYLNATQEYIDFCASNGYVTKVFFTTGPVDDYSGEASYNNYLRWKQIRDYVRLTPSAILFDYADILCYNDDGSPGTAIWNGITYPVITNKNEFPTQTGHISNAGALRLAKAMWWMLARIAGWDGE